MSQRKEIVPMTETERIEWEQKVRSLPTQQIRSGLKAYTGFYRDGNFGGVTKEDMEWGIEVMSSEIAKRTD